MRDENTRQHFRIVYPWQERPRFIFQRSICEVIDCSERGLRFRLTAPPFPSAGEEIEGKLRLQRGQEVSLSGMVVRVDDGEVALRLTEPGVSFYVILKEQIHLRTLQPEPEENTS
jgi:hypothetical protein